MKTLNTLVLAGLLIPAVSFAESAQERMIAGFQTPNAHVEQSRTEYQSSGVSEQHIMIRNLYTPRTVSADSPAVLTAEHTVSDFDQPFGHSGRVQGAMIQNLYLPHMPTKTL